MLDIDTDLGFASVASPEKFRFKTLQNTQKIYLNCHKKNQLVPR